MKSAKVILLIILGMLLILVLTACAAQGAEEAGRCPTPTEDTLLFTHEEQGYCVLYPQSHQPIEAGPEETVFAVGSLMDVSNPRIFIKVTDAAGQDTATAADQIERDFGNPGISGRSTATLGGEEAVVLDDLMGQDINRRLVVVHNGRLYDLTFVPVGADYGELADRTEQVYQLMLDSFTFLP